MFTKVAAAGAIVAAAVVVVVVVRIALFAGDYAERAESEYATAAAIRATTAFVESHEGRWPRSWDELGFPVARRTHVNFRFDVTSQQIVAEPELIHTVILPLAGYRIYPHAQRDLDDLLLRLRAFNRLQVTVIRDRRSPH